MMKIYCAFLAILMLQLDHAKPLDILKAKNITLCHVVSNVTSGKPCDMFISVAVDRHLCQSEDVYL